jgi:hypothetical protein
MNRKQLRALTDRVLGREVGCGDSLCVFGCGDGMHTNGGCQCMKGERLELQIAASRLHRLLTADDVVDTGEAK